MKHRATDTKAGRTANVGVTECDPGAFGSEASVRRMNHLRRRRIGRDERAFPFVRPAPHLAAEPIIYRAGCATETVAMPSSSNASPSVLNSKELPVAEAIQASAWAALIDHGRASDDAWPDRRQADGRPVAVD